MDCFVASAPRNDAALRVTSGSRPLSHGEADLTNIAASYVCGTAEAPLLGETIGQSLDLAVQRWARRAMTSAGRGENSPRASMRSRPASLRLGWNAARGSASGR